MNGYGQEYLEAAGAMFQAMGVSEARACKCAANALASEIDRATQQHGACGAGTLQARAAELRCRTQGLRAEDRQRHAPAGVGMSVADDAFVRAMLHAARTFGEDLQQPTEPGEQLVWKLLEAERELSDAMGLPPTAHAATLGFLAVAMEDAIDLQHLKDMLRLRALDAREHAEAERRMPPTPRQHAEGLR